MFKRVATLLLLMLLLVIMSSCGEPGAATIKERERKAKESNGDIQIAIVWTNYVTNYLADGVNMAIDEVNSQGGINGRKLKAIYYRNIFVLDVRELQIINSIANNTDIVAVIGHYDDTLGVIASVTYETKGVLMITPAVTMESLTQHNFNYIFRNIPKISLIANHLVQYMIKQGYKSLIVIDDRTEIGDKLADYIIDYADDNHIAIRQRKSYSEEMTDFKPMFAEIKNDKYDALFLSGRLPVAGKVIKQARLMNISKPIIGSHLMDSSSLWDIAGSDSNNVVVSTVFNPNDPYPSIASFVANFRTRYSHDPDTWAAQGYDAVKLLAHTYKRSGTTVPLAVSSWLKYVENWDGATGNYSFTPSGDIKDKKLYYKKMLDGKFVYLQEHE